MEFPFYVSKALPTDQDGFAILDAGRMGSLNTTSYNLGPYNSKSDSTKGQLVQILDRMGEASSKAQGLGQVITTYSKFVSSEDNRLYIIVEDNRVCGILKLGKKNLFHYDGSGQVKELRPLCVLDFYVHESVQRKGVGKILFEKMLDNENIEPHRLAYDRPSPKFIGFLQKHYGLSQYVPQNNNFVVFDQYWGTAKKTMPSNIKPKEQSFYQAREKRLESNKMNSQTETYAKPSATQTQYEYQRLNQTPQKQRDSITRNSEDKYGSRFSVGRKAQEDPSLSEFETQIKSADETFLKQNAKSSNSGLEKGKPQIWNVPNGKAPSSYTSQAPWANFESNMDSYKSSLAYGSHYNQGGANFRKK